jgi:hypothetical protein
LCNAELLQAVERGAPVCNGGFVHLDKWVNRIGMTDMAAVRDNKAQSRFELDMTARSRLRITASPPPP